MLIGGEIFLLEYLLPPSPLTGFISIIGLSIIVISSYYNHILLRSSFLLLIGVRFWISFFTTHFGYVLAFSPLSTMGTLLIITAIIHYQTYSQRAKRDKN